MEPGATAASISETRRILENTGQRLKSAVENPVVEIMEATWKRERRSACLCRRKASVCSG